MVLLKTNEKGAQWQNCQKLAENLLKMLSADLFCFHIGLGQCPELPGQPVRKVELGRSRLKKRFGKKTLGRSR